MAGLLSADLSFEERLTVAAATLPRLTETRLLALIRKAERLALTQPRLGWAMLAVANAAATHQPDRLLQARAAWHMGWAANEWVQPKRVAAAMDLAQPLFAAAGETGWVAACVWQRNALPWTRPSFPQAQTELETALAELIAHPDLAHFVPHCQLSLAYAYLLNFTFAESLALLDESEATFKAQGDLLNEARCWYSRSACFRRKNDFEAAMTFAQQALVRFTELKAYADIARTKCLLGYHYWLLKRDYAAARTVLEQALKLFTRLEMPAWVGQCQSTLGQIYYKTGNFVEAHHYLQQAIPLLRTHELIGVLGDALYDKANLESSRGNYGRSLELLQEAQTLAEAYDIRNLQALVLLARGAIFLAQGRYQNALASLEQVHHYYETTQVPGRLASTELHLADVWLQLGQPDRASDYLDKALKNSQQAQQADLFGRIVVGQTATLFKQNKPTSAIHLLETELDQIQSQDERPELAVMQRLLGQALCVNNELEKAEFHLRAAENLFQEMDMTMERAVCKLAWGTYYRQKGDFAAAAAAWEQALTLSQGIIPDIAWQVHAGLAQLAQQQQEDDLALTEYKMMIDELARLREQLTQMSLSGSFFSQPGLIVDQAVHLAVQMQQHEQALHFVEASKAITLARLLHTDTHCLANLPAPYDKQLADLIAHIHWLEDQLREQTSPRVIGGEEHQWQRKLKRKTKEYDQLMNQFERMMAAGQLPSLPSHRFDQSLFQRLATQFLGHNWVAVDYYLTETHLFGLILTADNM